jgi:outer membrane protein assembly factor BamD (BamD/ComL family)
VAVAALLITCWWGLSTTAVAQSSPVPRTGQFWVSLGGGVEGDNQDDPGYSLYREGYRLVLDGRWEQAVHAFKDLQQRYPASAYSDDAAYWSAYSLKHVQPTSAREAYRAFIERYRQSSYFDDAVADLEELEAYTVQLAGEKAGQSAGVSSRAVLAPGLQRLEREPPACTIGWGSRWSSE